MQLFRELFEEELETYSVQVEEFTSFGDLEDLSKYLKKAQALNSKLDAAIERVNADICNFTLGAPHNPNINST